jgi:hypothetical protein
MLVIDGSNCRKCSSKLGPSPGYFYIIILDRILSHLIPIYITVNKLFNLYFSIPFAFLEASIVFFPS